MTDAGGLMRAGGVRPLKPSADLNGAFLDQ